MPTLISDKCEAWKAEANARFDQLKANGEELNRISAVFGSNVLSCGSDSHVADTALTIAVANPTVIVSSLSS